MGYVDKSRKAPKGLIDICILDIIGEASEQHPVTQERIRALLESEYGIRADRKSVHRHLASLVEGIGSIRYSEKVRTVNGEEATMLTDFWLDSDGQFDDLELRALIYTVIFAKHIPVKYKRDLIGKLEALSSGELHRTMGNHIFEDANTADDFNQLFFSMETIVEAIEEKKKVIFRYTHYVVGQKKPQEMRQTYTVSPLGIGVRDDDFYLVATVNGVQDTDPRDMQKHLERVVDAMETKEVHVNTFRMDRISDIEMLDEPRDEIDAAKSLRLRGVRWNRLDVQEYIRENPSLASGHTVRARFRLVEGERCTISDAIDHFGKGNVNVQCENPNDPVGEPKSYIVSVRVNDGALRDFALRNTPDVEVLKPDKLRAEILDAYRKALGSSRPSLRCLSMSP